MKNKKINASRIKENGILNNEKILGKDNLFLKNKDRLGLSPLISMVMVIAFSIVGIVLVLNTINPTIEKTKDATIISEAQQNLQLLNSIIKEVASEANGSKRTITISITDGVYYFDPMLDYLYFSYNPSQPINLIGTKGDIQMESGTIFSDYFNRYLENSDASETWTIINGSWKIVNGRYYGNNGIAYRNLGFLRNFIITSKIYTTSIIGGEVFLLPKNPINLIGYWTFDENGGNLIYDFSMNSNNGTMSDDDHNNEDGNKPPRFARGKFSSALEFDGIDDFVNLGNESIFDLGTKSFTITFWIKPKEQFSSEVSILEKGGYGLSGYSIRFLNSTKTIAFYYASSEGWSGEFAPQVSVPTNEWSYIAVVVNQSAGKGTSYKNGIMVGEKSLPTYYSNEDSNLYIGKSSYYRGDIDEIRIYNIALNSDEILEDYHTGIKKLSESGSVKIDNQIANGYLVLSAPLSTYFDDVKVHSEGKDVKLIIPYRYDLLNFVRISKGAHNIVIENKGLNVTSGKVMINVKVE